MAGLLVRGQLLAWWPDPARVRRTVQTAAQHETRGYLTNAEIGPFVHQGPGVRVSRGGVPRPVSSSSVRGSASLRAMIRSSGRSNPVVDHKRPPTARTVNGRMSANLQAPTCCPVLSAVPEGPPGRIESTGRVLDPRWSSRSSRRARGSYAG